MLLVRLGGAQFDLMEKIGNPCKFQTFSCMFNSRNIIISFQSMDVSTNKLVKRFFLTLTLLKAPKQKYQTSTKLFLTSFSESNSA